MARLGVWVIIFGGGLLLRTRLVLKGIALGAWGLVGIVGRGGFEVCQLSHPGREWTTANRTICHCRGLAYGDATEKWEDAPKRGYNVLQLYIVIPCWAWACCWVDSSVAIARIVGEAVCGCGEVGEGSWRCRRWWWSRAKNRRQHSRRGE